MTYDIFASSQLVVVEFGLELQNTKRLSGCGPVASLLSGVWKSVCYAKIPVGLEC